MNKIILSVLMVCFSLNLLSQAYQVKWGSEFKFDKNSADLELIFTDNSGIYIKETHLVKKRLSLVNAVRESATLIKCDKNLNKIYTSDFNRELRGKEFERIMFLNNNLFLFATDYIKRDGTLMLYGVEIDKKNGRQIGEWKELAGWEKEEKRDDLDYQLSYNFDSTKLLVVSTRQGNSKNKYEVRQYDENLAIVSKPVTIANEFNPKTFNLEDVLFTESNTVLIVATLYGQHAGKGGRQYNGYSLRLYSSSGKLIKDINTTNNGKLPIKLKVIQQNPQHLAFIAFYAVASGEPIKGIIVGRIDPQSGEIINSDSQEITTEFTSEDDNSEDLPDSVKVPAGTNVAISKTMNIRYIVPTRDNGIIVAAESFNQYSYSRTSSSSAGSMGGYSKSTNFYTAYDCGEVMVFKVGSEGKIKWLKILPKFQHEVIETGSTLINDFGSTGSYFVGGLNRPYYAGFGIYVSDKTFSLILNDYDVNAHIIRGGQKPRNVNFLGHTLCYAVNYNIADGACTRDILFDNKAKGVPTAMPRMGRAQGSDFYIVGKQDRLLGKSRIAIARLSFSE